jgi:hypothetical protein
MSFNAILLLYLCLLILIYSIYVFYTYKLHVEAVGLDDPLHKIYITTYPLEGLPVLLFLFLLTYLPKLGKCLMSYAVMSF